ncbi:MAG TPA: hypothetical protein VMV77_04700 [Bacteroidales bacterium]|nr:hypothetical protein [Bacteroidales bacterium]
MEYEILIKGKAMHPTGGKPYRFKTYQEAKDMVSICYGLDSLSKNVSIVKIGNYESINRI